MTEPTEVPVPRRPPVRKSEELRRALAGQLLQTLPGDPLPPIRAMALSFGSSIGATQIALSQLAEQGIVSLDSRPGRGGFLVERDIGRLYEESERVPLLIALALPSTERINGLATAIRASLNGAGVETYLTFIRGSRPRIAALAQGRCNIAVMSRLAAGSLAEGPEFTTILALPAGTFVREHRVFLAPGGPPSGGRMRVGIDRSSYDFERLTELEFGDTAEYVPLNYLKFVREIEAGRIDAAILDVDDVLMRIPAAMPSRALSAATREILGESNLETAFVGRTSDLATQAVIRACLDPATMVEVQEEVIAGRRPPEY